MKLQVHFVFSHMKRMVYIFYLCLYPSFFFIFFFYYNYDKMFISRIIGTLARVLFLLFLILALHVQRNENDRIKMIHNIKRKIK